MNDIEVYVYTAWDGYAWQRCGGELAADLDRCMKEAGTMPESLDAAMPFGGAVRCVVGGKRRTAAYRYHVRRNGDKLGRDSLYVAVALVPLWRAGLPRVDFALLFNSPPLARPLSGEVGALTIPLLDVSRADPPFAAKTPAPVPSSLQGPGVFEALSDLFQDDAFDAARIGAVLSKAPDGAFSATVDFALPQKAVALREARKALCEAIGDATRPDLHAAVRHYRLRAVELADFANGFSPRFAELDRLVEGEADFAERGAKGLLEGVDALRPRPPAAAPAPAPPSPPPAPVAAAPAPPPPPGWDASAEVEKLRGDLARLRNENGQLRQQLQKGREAARRPAKAPPRREAVVVFLLLLVAAAAAIAALLAPGRSSRAGGDADARPPAGVLPAASGGEVW